jgi:hypothetical protein
MYRQVGCHCRAVSLTWIKQNAYSGPALSHIDPQSPHLPGQTDYGLQLEFGEDALVGTGAQSSP